MDGWMCFKVQPFVIEANFHGELVAMLLVPFDYDI